MRLNTLKFAVGVLCLTTAPLSADSVIPQIADGQPWQMTDDDGRTAEMTLNPDGSGQVRMGIFRRSISWVDSEGLLCLSGTPNGDQCMSLSASASGFTGQRDDGGTMELRR